MKANDSLCNGDTLLPVARRQRWQPLRGGLLNIYRYDYQEFWYEDGRLLLRGNNGTGKSRVLALQLPFLLDGEIVPQRVEPDQDVAKRMEWNLLLGGKHDDRLGYTWLEFGRILESGEAEYKTIGCALRAVDGRGIVQQWFFVTKQRIGRDLFLENETRQPLSKTKLEFAIGDQGKVFGSGKIEEDRRAYRNAVNSAFFGLGDRYDGLINLLIQLRQPQLSRTLNEARLSEALSQALPPLPENVLGDVAEAFRGLENDRRELDDLKAARSSAEMFLKEYQRYIQIVARRRAETVRKTHSAYEGTMRRLRAAEEDLEKAQQSLAGLENQISGFSIEEQAAMAAESALRDSPQMKDAKALESARIASAKAVEDEEMARKDAEQAATALEKVDQQKKATAGRAADTSREWESSAARALENARAATLDDSHDKAVKRFNLNDTISARVELATAALNEVVKQRMEAAHHVDKLNRGVDMLRQQLTIAQQTFNRLESSLNSSIESERAAIKTVQSGTEALFVAYRAWVRAATEIHAKDDEELVVDFASWCESPEGDSPIAKAIKDAEREASHRLESQRANTEERLKIAEETLSTLERDLQRLRDGYHVPPPPPHTRDVNGRANRVGSTLWKLCDFHPTVSEAERANIEAALEASGLLDAWVTPDGQILDKDDHETVLAIGISEPAPKGWGLDVALIPSVHRQGAGDTAISGETVSAVLSQIGFGAGIGKVWVNSEGSWQNGPLRGKWNKPAAEHIGHSSRETARLCRIARLTVEIDTAKELARVIEQELQVLAERSAQLNHEIGESPSDGNVRQSLAQVESSRRAVNQFRLQLTEAELQATAARRSMVEAADQRDQTAADLGIKGWVDKISALIDATHNYRLTLAELWPAIRAQTEAQAQLAAVIEGVAEATQHRDQRNARHQQAKELAAAAAERFQTIENAVGSTLRDIQQKLENAIQRVADIRKKKEDASQKKSEQREQSAVAKAKISEITNDLTTKELERGGAIRGLVAFVATRQLTVAHSDFRTIETGEWSVARSVEIARLIESVLEIVDHSDEAWARNQRDIHHHFETLQTSLRAHGYMPEATMVDTIFVVSVQFQNRACTIAELHDHVVAMIQERQELLDARERQVLENYLIDEVAEHLHDLLHRALEWKQQINAELSERPMSTGMMLRFSWEPRPDLPTSFAEARRLLLGARGTWSPNQRAAVGEFLQQQIKAAQSANDTGTWQDHLSQAFDYRKWHQFGVERKQDGDWKHLTRRTHGTGSGGEKAIALTLPQLAAAAAHYRSADKNAPRLILLDEAFVGVDKNMRAKCMDLLRVFDLDVVMTSESEWGCYQTVPGIAIYQLSAREGIDAVYATRWVWNGKQRVRDNTPLPPARPPIADDELGQPVEIK